MGARRARSGAGLAAPRVLLSEVSQAGAASPARVAPGGVQAPAGIEARQEISMARAIRAHCLASGQSPAEIALIIYGQCGPAFGTTLVRAHRLAQGIALADVVAQVRARYVSEGRTPPRFSETLLSSYEGGQKRPGPEYLHYLCCVYQSEPADLGYEGPCLCGQRHRAPVLMLSGAAHAAAPEPGGPAAPGTRGHDLPGTARSAPPILTAVPSAGQGRPAEPGGRGPGADVAGPIGLPATQLPAVQPGRPAPRRPRPASPRPPGGRSPPPRSIPQYSPRPGRRRPGPRHPGPVPGSPVVSWPVVSWPVVSWPVVSGRPGWVIRPARAG